MNILIVENNPNTCYLIELLVHSAGHTPILTIHADQALEAFARFQVTLVILNLGLPGGDGFYLLGQLHRRSSVPIIAITTQNSGYADRALTRGANTVVTTPFSSNEFQVAIRELIAVHTEDKMKWI
jgi:DNA-binding response OmpR family regulator